MTATPSVGVVNSYLILQYANLIFGLFVRCCFPPAWFVVAALSERQRNVCRCRNFFFLSSSFSQTNFSKKIVAPLNLSEKGTNR
jgi:hypothetical protein